MDWIDPPVDRRKVARRSARLLLLGAGMVACASLLSSLMPRQSSAAGNAAGGAGGAASGAGSAPIMPLPRGRDTTEHATQAAQARGSAATVFEHAPLTDEAKRPLLGTLRTATHWLWFYAAPDEPLVTICTLKGVVLARAVPQSDVYRLFPDLNLDEMRDTPDTRQLMHAEPATRD